MAKNTRTKVQRENDRTEIAKRYLRKETEAQIAAALGLTQQMVSYDLAVVREEWKRSSVRDFDEAKAQELAKIDELERSYWRAWEASGAQNKDDPSEQAGDPRYLAGVQSCIERRCKLLGLDAPAKSELMHGGKLEVEYGDSLSSSEREAIRHILAGS